MPPVFIKLPTRMKKGIARRVKLVVLEYIRAGTMRRRSACPSTRKKIIAVRPMATTMGRPTMICPTRTAKMASVIIAEESSTTPLG
jgi:hypothetical protein